MAAIRFLGWVPFALVGCGRLGFAPQADVADAGEDVDAPDAMMVPLCERVTDAIYCNDFEGGGLKGAGNAGADLVTGGGWNGSDGFRVKAQPGEMPHLAFNLPTAITSGELHIGGRLFLDAGPQSANFVVVAQALSDVFEKVSFDFNGFDRAQLVNTLISAGAQGPNDSFPRGRWVCFELAIVVAPAGGGGSAEVALDDSFRLRAFADLATEPPTGFSRVEIGTISSTMNTATEIITFDNWIISTRPIGCP